MTKAYDANKYTYEEKTLEWATTSKDAEILIGISMGVFAFAAIVGAGVLYYATSGASSSKSL